MAKILAEKFCAALVRAGVIEPDTSSVTEVHIVAKAGRPVEVHVKKIAGYAVFAPEVIEHLIQIGVTHNG